jgi:hypothetical protein
MVHGVEPIFPFDLSEATFLVPLPERSAFMTMDLIAWHAHQLQKHTEDLTAINEKVLKAHYSSICNFQMHWYVNQRLQLHARHISTCAKFEGWEWAGQEDEAAISRPYGHCKAHKGWLIYIGRIGQYHLQTAICIIPYSMRNPMRITVTSITGMNDTKLDHIANQDNIKSEEEEPKDVLDV